MTSDRIRAALDFARSHSRGVLMTIKSDGMPQASNIVHAAFDGAVHISVTDDRAKTANLRRDPRAALHVTSPDFGRWAVLEGTAQLSEVTRAPGDAAGALLRRVYEAVAGPHPDWDDYDRAMIADRRLVVSLPVTHAYGQGFS